MKVETNAKKTKAHTIYKVDGVRVPGVTTILNVLNKPALVKWANNLGLKGIDSSKYVDHLASIGTLAHYMVECEWRGEPPDLSEASPEEIDKAENALVSFYNWEEEHEVEPIRVEEPLVSTTYRYGGTVDCYAMVDGTPTLLDLKTSKGIWPEHFHQLAAYRQLLLEAGLPVESARILRIGRDEDEGFEDRKAGNLDKHWEVFEHCLALYQLLKEAK